MITAKAKKKKNKVLSECFIKTLLLAFVLESVAFVAASWWLSSEDPTSFPLCPVTSVALKLSPEASVAFWLSLEVAISLPWSF